MSALAVERRSAADDEELFRLYREVFGNNLTEASRRRWRWQYLENPANGAEGPEIWVARERDRLLGQYASMPVRLFWEGREVRASWGMDVFVSAEARGRGIGAELFTKWSDNVDVALGLGLTPSSYGLFKKLRYADVGPVPFYWKILDARAIARKRLPTPLARPGGVLLGLALRGLYPERPLPKDKTPTDVRPITGFGAEYDTLWERVRVSYAMCVRRDAAYLEWKYARCPHRRYDLWEARQVGALKGFGVSRHEDFEGTRLGWVIDVFADATDHATKDALIGAILASFRTAGVARAQAFSMNGALAQDLQRRGFFRGRSPMQFCVRSCVGGDRAFSDLWRWNVVFGDSDMDR